MHSVRRWTLPVLALLLCFGSSYAHAEEGQPGAPAGAIPLDTPLQGGAPNVVGMSQDDALRALDDAGLESEIVTVVSDKVGVVLEQLPAAGKDIHTGDRMTLHVGIKALVQTQVPNVVGMDEASLDALSETYFIAIQYVQGDPSKVGLVVSQTPPAGQQLAARGRLTLQIVRGNSIVPSVVGKSEADAKKIIEGARLRIDVTHVEDAGAAEGTVLSQEPQSGAEALPMSTVSVRVAGHAHDHDHDPVPEPVDPKEDIGVPSLVGMKIEQAQDALFALNLVPAPEFVDGGPGTPAWTVLNQDPAPQTRVGVGAVVRFQVAKEAAPQPTVTLVNVPNVVGLKADHARQALYSAGLQTRKIYRTLPDADSRRVAEQYPAAGGLVPQGTRVTYVMPRTAVMPQLLGLTKADALLKLTSAGFNGLAQQIGMGGGTTEVTWQQFPVGVELSRGSTVQFKYTVVPIAQPLVHVPNVLGMSRVQATALLQSNGFQVVPQNIGGSGPHTEVVDQNPNGGTLRVHGSSVVIRYKRKGLVGLLKPVPNVLGKSRNQAAAILQAAGFQVTATKVGGGMGAVTQVIDQDPNAGTLRPAGFLVKIRYKIVFGGGLLKPVPNVLGKTRNQATAILQSAGFTVTALKVGGSGPATQVVDTDPNPGTLRPSGSLVRIKYKRTGGIGLLKPIPNVIGKTRGQGRAILQAAGFQVHQVPVGGVGPGTVVVDTDPNPGTLRPAGSTVRLEYKRTGAGPGGGIGVLVKVPQLKNRSRGQAKAMLQALGLKTHFVGPFLAPRVKNQSRPAGSKVPKGTTITLSMGF